MNGRTWRTASGATSALENPRRLFGFVIATVAMLFANLPCFSQVWPVRSILENVHTGGVLLKDIAGNSIAKVTRASVETIDTVTNTLAGSYGLRTPRTFIVKEISPNAFVTLDHGEPILCVNTAMLSVVGNDRDLMAVVIGHEMGHLKAGHLTQGRKIREIVSIIGIIAGAALDVREARRGVDTGGLGTNLGATGSALVNAKFSRDQEREADDLGIQYMTKAGYDPYAARRFWDLMESKGGGESGLWMSSHPSNVERKGTLSALAAAYSPNKTTDPPLPKYDDPYPPAMYSSLEPSLEESSAEPLGSYANGRTLYKAGRIEEALPFLQKAAESGDERAALLIGECEQAGRLGLPDYTKARENFQLAAKMGLSAGITGLAMQSLSGKGAPLDHKEGARLLSIAAGRGEPRAYGLLALMYMEGVEPFPRDLIMTRQLAEKSAAAGDGAGRAILGVLLRNGVGGDANQQRSFALLTLAVNDSKINTFAQYNLGVSYETGAGTPVDKAKAVELYRLAASRQFQPAVERLKVLKLSQ